MSKDLLHVEDYDSWLEEYSDLAHELGLNLRQYTSGEDALRAIKEKVPDILITDLHVKGRISGYEVVIAAQKAGVRNITIASNTESPSEQPQNVKIQSKIDAMRWLRGLVQKK